MSASAAAPRVPPPAAAEAFSTCPHGGSPGTGPSVRHYGDWSVRSTVNSRGGNVMVIIDGAGAVKWISGVTPR
jgi:hypothetical protein